MDNRKDIKRTENISHFVDKQTIKTHPFGENKMGERAYRRAERLVAALYLLTNHIPSDEPIRRIVREQAASILLEILAARDQMRTAGSLKIQLIGASIRHVISLTRILAVAGFVSFENADILTDALDELGSFMESSRRSVLSESVRLSRDNLLDVRDMTRDPIKDIKDRYDVKDTDIIKDNLPSPFGNQIHQKDTSSGTTMNHRMTAILEVLGVGTDLGIKEIAINLPEYSEKMIQRELADLIAQGYVKKLGFRRWSKYALASSNSAPDPSMHEVPVNP
ncbi:MAG TPA: hypothetical protein VMU13_00260 [Candidatus Paceibacterota bacterium]|nr:hypothetical protein [Candidatus Paceibacterota bacterium]